MSAAQLLFDEEISVQVPPNLNYETSQIFLLCDAPVFYNPRMEFNRDTSILALQAYQKEANIELRTNMGLFDVIDIDPFGTPSPFVDSAAYNLKRDSLLCLTATDTSCLSGTYKEPCIRKYNAKPYKSEYYHENGIRILIGFAALTLAKYQKHIEVKLSHSSEHYMRVYLKVIKGSKATDESLKNIGYISHCKNCLYRSESTGFSTADVYKKNKFLNQLDRKMDEFK